MNHHKYLTDQDLVLIRSTLARFRLTDPRDVLMFDVLLATGARASEMLALRPCDLDSSARMVFLTGLKGSNDRSIPLNRELFTRLVQHASSLHPTERLFKISYSRLQQLWALYRPVPKKLHSLRHTFAIALYRRTLDLQVVQHALGHRSLTSTSIYLQYRHSPTELRQMMGID